MCLLSSRFLKACNVGLSKLIDEKIGEDWPLELDKLQELKKYKDIKEPELDDDIKAKISEEHAKK